MNATSATHVGHRGISPNTWQAANGARWDAILGYFQTEFGNGPKIKFVVLVMLYNFD
jgi:hypothetical protein